MTLDYELMRVIWWLLLGILLIGFAVMDGFDLGVSTLLPFIAKNDVERRIVINTIGPFWEGNQVWLILGGGAIFAAWPYIYAVTFSGLYLALFLLLSALILRPVAFKYRSKLENKTWRKSWDWVHFFTGIVPSLLTGVAVGNVILGLPFKFYPDTLQVRYMGSFFALLNPFALLIGLVSLTMLIRHGAIYAAMKTEGEVARRSAKIANIFSAVMVVFYVIASVWVFLGINGYKITSNIVFDGPSNPLYKTVEVVKGGWSLNYMQYKWMFIAPLLSIFCSLIAGGLALKSKYKTAFICSSLSIFGVISTVGLGMFPVIIPSSINPSYSLTVWDSSSSLFTLKLMLLVVVIFLPVVMLYTAWVYRVLRGKVVEAVFNDTKKDLF